MSFFLSLCIKQCFTRLCSSIYGSMGIRYGLLIDLFWSSITTRDIERNVLLWDSL